MVVNFFKWFSAFALFRGSGTWSIRRAPRLGFGHAGQWAHSSLPLPFLSWFSVTWPFHEGPVPPVETVLYAPLPGKVVFNPAADEPCVILLADPSGFRPLACPFLLQPTPRWGLCRLSLLVGVGSFYGFDDGFQ